MLSSAISLGLMNRDNRTQSTAQPTPETKRPSKTTTKHKRQSQTRQSTLTSVPPAVPDSQQPQRQKGLRTDHDEYDLYSDLMARRFEAGESAFAMMLYNETERQQPGAQTHNDSELIDISETAPAHLSTLLSDNRSRQFRQLFVKLRIHTVIFVFLFVCMCLSIFYFPYMMQNNFDREEHERLDNDRVWGPDGAFESMELDKLGLSLGYYDCDARMKVGQPEDSNWTVCWDTMRARDSCIAYVFRPIVGNLSFEVGLQRLGCQVFLFYYKSEYDRSPTPTFDYRNTRRDDGIYTIRMMLSDREVGDHWCWSSNRCEWEEHTLVTIMQMMNHSFVDLVRVGNHSQNVWPVFTQMIHDIPFEAQRVGQLLIELDLVSNPAPIHFIEPLQTLRQNEYELFSRIPSANGKGLKFLLSYVMYSAPTPHPTDWSF